MIRRIPGGVTAPLGFLAHGTRAGIKAKGLDLALILSDRPAAAAGVLTQHQLAAPPVKLTRKLLRSGRAQAIIVNSGNANCCTGPVGERTARQIQRAVARSLRLPPQAILVASTGVIGKPLPTKKALQAIPRLVQGLGRKGSREAAQAILTTDLVTKSTARSVRIPGGTTLKIGGIAKGSGMINPSMATMLCFLTTDAAVAPAALKTALKAAADKSFNAITVDGQMSTNDTVLLLANGLAGNPTLRPGAAGWKAFTRALEEITRELACAIVRDGEGASRFLTVQVKSARNAGEARLLAKAIANAPLIKTMVKGQDPNWGRVAATVGATRVRVNPKKLEIALGGIPVYRGGKPVSVGRKKLKTHFSGRKMTVCVALHTGLGQAQVKTCDLTEGYVRINAKYS